jgi:hypothetical protein
MIMLFFFSVSLLCSALSMKVEALNEANALTATIECVEAPVRRTLATGSIVAASNDDVRGQLNQGTQFYPVLKLALEQFDCRAITQIHLQHATEPADANVQPVTALKRALAALCRWGADFAICRDGSHAIVAVVTLRPNGGSREPERADLEKTLGRNLSTAHVPVVLVAEAASYDVEHIASLVRPHLAEASQSQPGKRATSSIAKSPQTRRSLTRILAHAEE